MYMYMYINKQTQYTCTYSVHVQYLTLLSLHTITVLPLTTVYIVIQVHCISNVLHSITP